MTRHDPDCPCCADAARHLRRAERERAARIEAEAIAERTTSELFETLSELRGAEARTRIVTEAAALLTRGGLDMTATLETLADAAARAFDARQTTFMIGVLGEDRVEQVVTTERDPARRRALLATVGGPRLGARIWSALPGAEVAAFPEADASAALPPALRDALGCASVLAARLETLSTGDQDWHRAFGSLLIGWDAPRAIGRHDELVARSFAGMAILAIESARLHAATLASLAEARERAALDPLTGLANHRTFHDRLEAEAARAMRHGRRLSLALIDLDRFKQVNDVHGHQAGDRALVAVARVLDAHARSGDLVARVGGEEFAWLMPETDGLQAWHVAERARHAIAAERIAPIGTLSISAGVCDLDQAPDASTLHRLADGALYWAKHHGRDVVFRYTPDVVRALSAEEEARRVRREQALQSIRMLARAVDAKDSFTREHSERVADLAAGIAARLGWPPERVELLHEAGLVHDVGKLVIPDELLTKPGPLDAAEYATLKTHAALGGEIVSEAFDAEQVAWVRGHHERWDGRGYPDGLAGDGISAGAAILALADAWDAMTSARPYRPAGTAEAALAEVRRERGGQFAPWAVDAFVALAETAVEQAGAID